MSISNRKRGRPRGSGIDDTRTIQQILELLERNPEMKPTTAIRALGIENESVIRRLRDKIRSAREQTLTPSQAQSARQPITAPAQAESSTAGTASAPLNVQSDPVRRAEAPPAMPTAATQPVPDEPKSKAEAAAEQQENVSSPKTPSASIDSADPFTKLPMAIVAATFSAGQFLAMQNALFFQASLQRAMKPSRPKAHKSTCPACGHHLH